MSFDKNLLSLIDELYFFNYELDYSDFIWRVIFLDEKNKWHHLFVRKYEKTYYLGLADNHEFISLEIENGKNIKAAETHGFSSSSRFYEPNDLEDAWGNLIIACRKWLKSAKKDWIKLSARITTRFFLHHKRIGESK